MLSLDVLRHLPGRKPACSLPDSGGGCYVGFRWRWFVPAWLEFDVMRNDPEFNIQFVGIVEKFPHLYDYTLENYTDKRQVEVAWEEIGRQVNETGAACRERWSTLRGNFSRALRSPPSSSTNKTKREYYLTKYLQFLIPFMKSRPLVNNSTPDGECSQSSFDDPSQISELCTAELVIPHDEDQLSDLHHGAMVQEDKRIVSFDSVFARKRKRSVEDLESTAEDFAECRKRRKASFDYDNADLNFLKSLLPDMNRLEPRKKNRFKVLVINALNELTYGEASCSTTSSTS